MNALHYGFVFVRARGFNVPEKVRVGSKSVSLHFPQEQGVTTDFFTCFIRNDYGLRQRLAGVRTILDIGANIGFFSVAARSYYPQSLIHAYEPNPRVLPFLKTNTDDLRIAIYPEAVGGDDGHVELFDSGASNQAQTVASEAGTIRQVSLQTAIDRLGGSVDLLKLDCEGAEWEMFKHPEPWMHIRNIRMEYHLFHGETEQDVERNLNSLGFEVTHWQPDVGFGIVWAARSRQIH
jgi:FkbM family methyltransferase